MKLILLLSFSSLLFACSSGNVIEGKWRLTEIDFSEHLNTLDSESKKTFEAIISKQSEMLDQTFFDFLSDSVLHVITPKKDGSGQIMQIEKWATSKNLDSLYMINSETELFHVKLVGNDTLILFSDTAPKRKLVLLKSE